MSNLAKRVASAVVGVPILFLLMYMGGIPFFLLILLVMLLATVELGRVMDAKGVAHSKALAPIFSLALGAGAFFGLAHLGFALTLVVAVSFIVEVARGIARDAVPRLSSLTLSVVYVGWMLSHFLLLRNPATSPYLGALADSLHLRDPGLFFVVFVVGVTFLEDTTAYFVGRRFGKMALIPSISPGKTVEGTIGGFVGAVVGGVSLWAAFGFPMPLYSILAWSVVVAVAGVFGDLAESLLKRDAQMKDSGGVIPGHGGVLDRFDSLIFSAPASYYFLILLSIAWGVKGA
ncbi:MAG: phosphatidate cytidylyltransferase [Candidatus Methanosuratincola sp.]|jgi:phosphatidate cytidylyltransferase